MEEVVNFYIDKDGAQLWGVILKERPLFKHKLRLIEDARLKTEGGFSKGTILSEMRNEELHVGERTQISLDHVTTMDMLVDEIAHGNTYEWEKREYEAQVVSVERHYRIRGQWSRNEPSFTEVLQGKGEIYILAQSRINRQPRTFVYDQHVAAAAAEEGSPLAVAQ